MSTGATESASAGEVTKQGLERLPVKTPYAHDAILRIQRLDATLGGLGLLEVAKGLLPAEVFEITIIDLSDVPAPAPGAPAATPSRLGSTPTSSCNLFSSGNSPIATGSPA